MGPRLTICLLLCLVLVSCSKESEVAVPQSTLRLTLGEEPGNIDPIRTGEFSALALSRQVFQTLYRYQYLSRESGLRPDLASSMPEISDDLLTYTVHLREGVRFADDPVFPGGKGREIVAEDVAYSIKRHFDPGTRSQWTWFYEDRIAGVDAWQIF